MGLRPFFNLVPNLISSIKPCIWNHILVTILLNLVFRRTILFSEGICKGTFEGEFWGSFKGICKGSFVYGLGNRV